MIKKVTIYNRLQPANFAWLKLDPTFIVPLWHKSAFGMIYVGEAPMIEFEDQDYAKYLLLLAERIKSTPSLIQTLSQEELLKAWRWIDDNVFLKTSTSDEEQVIVIIVSHETTVLQGLFKQIKSEITKRDQATSSNERTKTSQLIFMSKRHFLLALIILVLFFLGALAVHHDGGKISVSKDGLSYEHTNLPTSTAQPENILTLIGTISLNGRAPRNGEIVRVYLRDNTIVQSVTPDGNAFVLGGVPIPENNVVRVALDLQNGQCVSQQFLLPIPKNGISDLGECIFFSSQVSSDLAIKKPKTALPKHTPNPQSDEKIEINNPTFNGPTQIGGQGNTQIIGPKPREVSNGLIREIEGRVLDKNIPVHVCRRSNDAESYDYATKIVLALIARGYKNSAVDGIIDDRIIGGDPIEAARQQRQIAYRWENWEGGRQLNIAIPSSQ